MVIKDKELFDTFFVNVKMEHFEVCEPNDTGGHTVLIKCKNLVECFDYILRSRMVRTDKELTVNEYNKLVEEIQDKVRSITTRPQAASPQS
jgi:hypothetical protein